MPIWLTWHDMLTRSHHHLARGHLPLYTTQSLRGNYLQADAFFANPEIHDCYSVGNNSCSRLPQCAQELDNRGNAVACLELVNRCSDATRTICENGAVQMSASRSTNQDLVLCEWDRRQGCIMPSRRRDRTYVSVKQSRNAAPRPVNSLPRLAYIEEVTDFSEDYE